MRKDKAMTLPYDSLVHVKNVRIAPNYNVTTLREAIELHGLDTPLTVWLRDDGIVQILRGHRRHKAIGEMTSAKRLEVFPDNKIPVIQITGITPTEALLLMVDQGNTQPLTDKHELQLAANALFDARLPEADVAVTLAGIIDAIAPMEAPKRKELAAIESAIAEGKKTDSDKREFIAGYRRGFVQDLKTRYACPTVVMDTLREIAEGDSAPIKRITNKQAKDLLTAHYADMDSADAIKSGYSKDNPGPKFLSAWKKLITPSATKTKEPTVAKKSMSSKALLDEIRQGLWNCELTKLTIQRAAGDNTVDLDRMKTLDREFAFIQLIRENDADYWNNITSYARELDKTIKAETAKTAESVVAETAVAESVVAETTE